MKFSVGMATFDDFDGVYFTAMGLWLYHGHRVAEVIVVDNNPAGRYGKSLADFCGSRPGMKYVPFTAATGTAAPRNAVFEHAAAEHVVCVDSHVLLRPEALDALADYYKANPGSGDLVQGPLWYDALHARSTHFNDTWAAAMLGQWATAWECPCGGVRFDVVAVDGAAACRDLMTREPVEACGGDCGVKLGTVGGYPGHEARLRDFGCREAADTRPWFEIPAQGLGLFACRKEAWLGFHPRFRGFGGEEWYIHEKYRRAGRKAVCVSGLGWVHRFHRPAGVPYPMRDQDRVFNYVLGHLENGTPTDKLRAHFNLDDAKWAGYAAAAAGTGPVPGDPPPPAPRSSCQACPGSPPATLAAAYDRAANTPSDINEHVPTLRALAAGCDTVVELTSRAGESTAGLAAGKPRHLVVIDMHDPARGKGIAAAAAAEGVEVSALGGDPLGVAIPACDLLFLDTKHTGQQLYAELVRHAPQVRSRVAVHDTEIYGEKGEDGTPGLLHGLRRFLAEHPEWTTIRHDRNNHGLTVISRDPADKKPLPPAWKQAWNLAKAATRHALNGGTYLPLPLAEERLAECSLCDQRTDGRCAKCGCFLARIPDDAPVKAGQPGKVFYPTEACPLGKWHPRPDDGVGMTPDDLRAMLVPSAERGTGSAE